MSIHIIKLVVGVEDLDDFVRRSEPEIVDYEGQPAFPCWTRFMPKRADEILSSEGSIYRVINNRICCRLKILGFEMVETDDHGKMCMIMQEAKVMQTVLQPQRPFQGWRYFQPEKAPADRGVYVAGDATSPPDPKMEAELRAAGLL